MSKLLIATNNKNKLKEFQALLEAFNFELISLRELNLAGEVEEVESTYLGNALLKAKQYALLSGLPTLSDDSGLEIEALGNLPGIYSARFLGANTDYKIKNQIILDQLSTFNDRKAKYVCALALCLPTGETFTAIANLDGQISLESLGDLGFGYDPIFIPYNTKQTFAQMSETAKNKISHRALAVTQLHSKLKEISK